MNWLLIDFGNTRLKWACWNGEQLEPGGAIEHKNSPLQQLFAHAWGSISSPQRIIVVSVVKQQSNNSLSDWCSEAWGVTAEFLHSNVRACGVSSAYREPSQLGVDRWVALIAACNAFNKQPVCIADCGTATTIDTLDSNGLHLGGVILPGLTLMQDSLPRNTAGISLPSGSVSINNGVGQDTESAIAVGCVYATVGAMEQVAIKLCETVESEVICIITGGDALQLLPHLAEQWRHRPELVLEGAKMLADSNKYT